MFNKCNFCLNNIFKVSDPERPPDAEETDLSSSAQVSLSLMQKSEVNYRSLSCAVYDPLPL